jgi:hypothetical protein
VERVNRDGNLEVLQMGEAEVTPRERCRNWYAKAKIDERGRLPEDRYPTEEETHGNDMRRDVDNRTTLPRKHEYSTEARLAEARGEEVDFHKSKDCREKAVGITEGMVLSDDDKRTLLDADKGQKKEASAADPRMIEARVFERVAHLVDIDEISDDDIVDISTSFGVPVERVLHLERVAKSNGDLAHKYALLARRRRDPNAQCGCSRCTCGKDGVPGTVKNPEPGVFEKETDEDDLLETAKSIGLVE